MVAARRCFARLFMVSRSKKTVKLIYSITTQYTVLQQRTVLVVMWRFIITMTDSLKSGPTPQCSHPIEKRFHESVQILNISYSPDGNAVAITPKFPQWRIVSTCAVSLQKLNTKRSNYPFHRYWHNVRTSNNCNSQSGYGHSVYLRTDQINHEQHSE